MTLREIAEMITSDHHWDSGVTVAAAKIMTTLLNAVVKERAELIARSDEDIEITLRQAKKKALRELGLKGVWPGKEGK